MFNDATEYQPIYFNNSIHFFDKSNIILYDITNANLPDYSEWKVLFIIEYDDIKDNKQQN